MKLAVLISADVEWRAVEELFPGMAFQPTPYGDFAYLNLGDSPFILFHGGWGKISAAAGTQYVIDRFHPNLLINLGTCGGFEGRIETGTIILVEKTLVYDIIEQMGDGEAAIDHYASSMDLSWLPALLPHPVSRGLLLSADRDILPQDIPVLVEKYDAVAADWESGAIAWVAKRNQIRTLILRGVSDLVGGHGGEAYGNLELFRERTKSVMRELFRQLPEWAKAGGMRN